MKRKQRLFFFKTQFPNDKSVCNLVKVDFLQLLQERLGHLSFTDVKVTNSRISKCAKGFCQICVLCETTKVSVPKETEVRGTKLLEKVFIDMLEPLNNPRLQVFRSLLMIIDEFSKLKVVKLLRAKGEALEEFQNFIADHGIPKVRRSDYGKEFTSKHLKR